MPKTVLITGCAGFVGSHLCEHILKTTDWVIVGLDRLDETSTLERLATSALRDNRDRFRFVWHDLRAPINAAIAHTIGPIDLVLHLAASTHVDRSITAPGTFVMDNVVGTQHVLDYVRFVCPASPILYFSTDEVFGPAAYGFSFKEWARYRASNPYAATKAAGEELVVAYRNTYKLDTIITHCVNVFGERQHPEKYLPMLIRKLLVGEEIQVHADATCQVATSRFYIHARNVAAAVLHIVAHCEADQDYGEKWNIGSPDEVNSLDLAKRVGNIVAKSPIIRLVNSVSQRPGHDMRYSLDCSMLYGELGFNMPVDFEHSLEKTVRWYLANPKWLGL